MCVCVYSLHLEKLRLILRIRVDKGHCTALHWVGDLEGTKEDRVGRTDGREAVNELLLLHACSARCMLDLISSPFSSFSLFPSLERK